MRPSELILSLGEDDIAYGYSVSIECVHGSCQKEVLKRSCDPADRQMAGQVIDALSRRGLLDKLRKASERLVDPGVLCASIWYPEIWIECVSKNGGGRDCDEMIQRINATMSWRRGMLEELKRRAAGRLGRLLDDTPVYLFSVSIDPIDGGQLFMTYDAFEAVVAEIKYYKAFRLVDATVYVPDGVEDEMAEVVEATFADVLGSVPEGMDVYAVGRTIDEPPSVVVTFSATDPATVIGAFEAVAVSATSSGWILELMELHRRARRTRRVKA